MKIRAQIGLWLIGIINAVVFMFGSLTVTLIFRIRAGLKSVYDISDTGYSLAILGVCVAGVLNFFLIKKILDSNSLILKFLSSLIPFGAWLLTTAFFFITLIWGNYGNFVLGSGGAFIGNFSMLAYSALQLLNGVTIPISGVAAYFAHKRRENKLGSI